MPYQRQVSRPMRQTERKHLYQPQGKATFKTSMGCVPESNSWGILIELFLNNIKPKGSSINPLPRQ